MNKPKADAKLESLIRKAKRNTVEVEDILALTESGVAEHSTVLAQLCDTYRWPNESVVTGSGRSVPLGRWVEVVRAYLDGKYDALVDYARRPEPKSVYFALSVLETLKTREAVDTLARICSDLSRRRPLDPRHAVVVADTANILLSFRAATFESDAASIIRSFLHRMLVDSLDENARAAAVCALRGIGNAESIAAIERLPEFSAPWEGLATIAVRAIRRNMAAHMKAEGRSDPILPRASESRMDPMLPRTRRRPKARKRNGL